MRSIRLLLCAGALVAGACKSSDANVPTVGPNDRDHISVGDPDDEDAGPVSNTPDGGTGTAVKPDAGVSASVCERVEPLHSSGEDTPNLTSTDSPADFSVTRQNLGWNTDCANPLLTLELSDGTCPRGAGHELTITFSANAIADGQIHLGENQVTPDTESPIQARYVRPKRLTPHGTWGNCGSAAGQVIFLEAPDIAASTPLLQARYQFEAQPCDDTTTGEQLVVGAFRATLLVRLSEVCPDRAM
jgi:hypothetical protein